MLQCITSGESHGEYLIALLEGLPSGLKIDVEKINAELARRQQGYGRGPRMNIETDVIHVTSGVYEGKTTGAPVGLMIKNCEVILCLVLLQVTKCFVSVQNVLCQSKMFYASK